MTRLMPISETTYYEILNIKSTELPKQLSGQELKQAYRRALLLHHPDKLKPAEKLAPPPQDTPKWKVYSVDDITFAYKTLSDPKLRAEYDKQLRLSSHPSQTDPAFHTGLESVDLDDLAYDHSFHSWFGSCRCGDSKGFQITEADLEKESEEGEILTGCKGCSLWLRVLFAMSE